MKPGLIRKGLIFICIPLVLELTLLLGLSFLLTQAESEVRQQACMSQIIAKTEHLSILLSDAGSTLSAYILSGNHLFLEKFAVSRDRLSEAMGDLEQLAQLQSTEPELKETLLTVKEELSILDARNAEQGRKDADELTQFASKQTFKQICMVTEKLRGDCLSLIEKEQAIALRKQQSHERLRRMMVAAITSGAVLNVIIAVVLSKAYIEAIARRIGVIADNSLRLAGGQQLHALVAGNDEIAALDRAFHNMARELKEAAKKELATIENAADVILSLANDGRIKTVNQAALKAWGYDQNELIGSRLINFACPEDADLTIKALEEAKEAQDNYSFENRLKCKDGKVIDVRWSVVYSTLEQSTFCVAHDVTIQKEAQRLKAQVLAMVSHDLRTPLSSIRHALEMFEAGMFGEVSAEGHAVISRADRSAKRMLRLIQDLLEVERINAGTIELDRSKVSCEELIQQSIHTVMELARDQEIALTTKAGDGVVFADSERLVQVLVNLLSNAIKFSPRGSVVEVSALSKTDNVEFSITDQGRGIPSGQEEIIFQRFGQAMAQDASQGLGLGLSICKSLVELHGGTIRVESAGVRGSTFIFTIPRVD